MRSPLATSTEAPTTRSRVITRWTIESSAGASRSAAVFVCALAAEESSKARLRRVGVRMAGNYSHKRKRADCSAPGSFKSYLVYSQKSVINAIGVVVRANNGLVVVNAGGDGFNGARETDHKGV